MREFAFLLKRVYSFLFPLCKTGISALPLPPAKSSALQVKKYHPSGIENDLLKHIETYLQSSYEFRFNSLSEITEYRKKTNTSGTFTMINQRELNGICLELHRQGIECWDRDLSRYVNSTDVPAYHPMMNYMNQLPEWDGTDRVNVLAQRVSKKEIWVEGFHRWMLGLTAQWLGNESLHANSLAPVLISTRQGMHKSTFCKLLIPDALQAYYTDSFDLSSVSAAEQKLALFGLINLDEIDKFSPKKMVLLKNLMQMAGLNIRKAYKKNYSPLPRVASFIGTSNQKDLLTDPTGSRRFLCIEVEKKIDCSPIDHTQVYAQLKAELSEGMRHWFTSEEEKEIMLNNAPYRKRGMEEDIFFQCFHLPEKDEESVFLSAADIYTAMKKKHPAAMKEVSTIVLGRLLTSIGVERIHTRMGNRYNVCFAG